MDWKSEIMEKLSEKVKWGKFPRESEKFFGNRGILKQGECIIASGGMDAPDYAHANFDDFIETTIFQLI